MNIRTVNSIDALTELLQDGDVLINFTSEAIASLAPAVSISQDGRAGLIQGPAYPVDGNIDTKAVSNLVKDDQQLVVVTDGIDKSAEVVAQLFKHEVSHVVYVLDQVCAADDFMDEEDSEAVAERLRQLGYI